MSNEILPTFIRGVHTNDEYYDDCASHTLISIDLEQYQLIKKAQRFVKKMKGYSFTTFDYTPDFMDSKTDDDPTEEELKPNDDMRVDTIELKVTDDSIYWSGLIKNSSIEIYTDTITIEELDENFKVFKMPYDDLPTLINHCKYESSKKLLSKRLNNASV